MTEALYLKDSYLKEFDAKIMKVEGNKIILNQTAFYPESGGQPCDYGKIIRKSDNSEFHVNNVKKEGGEIVHYIGKEGLKENDEISGKIDWERRYKLMRMHTAAHILATIIHKLTGALITGNQLNVDKSRVDFDIENFNRDEMPSYFSASNDIAKWDLPIMVDIFPAEQVLNDKNLCKLAKGLPPGLKEIRIVEIEMFDKQACEGTHVKFTKEVGKIEFVDAENKGSNNRRIYFKLG